MCDVTGDVTSTMDSLGKEKECHASWCGERKKRNKRVYKAVEIKEAHLLYLNRRSPLAYFSKHAAMPPQQPLHNLPSDVHVVPYHVFRPRSSTAPFVFFISSVYGPFHGI